MWTDRWVRVCTGIAAHLMGLCVEWKLSLALLIIYAICGCFLLFFFFFFPSFAVSSEQYKVTWGKIKASLFHSWVAVTGGHVH